VTPAAGRVEFDGRTGRVRLTQATFDRLVAWSRGEGPADGGDVAALREAGALAGEGPAHPALAAGLRAVTEPVCRLRLTLTDATGGAHAGDGWVRGDAAALLLDLPGDSAGRRDLLAFHPSFLPAAIARTVRLGPRPGGASGPPVRLAADALEDLLSADPARRGAAAARVPNVLTRTAAERLAAATWRVWRAGMTWTGAGGAPAGREVRVADGGEEGLFLVESDGERGTLRPSTPTAVWRLLIRLLPDTAELG